MGDGAKPLLHRRNDFWMLRQLETRDNAPGVDLGVCIGIEPQKAPSDFATQTSHKILIG
jgi:hypothetical protein